MTDWRLTPVQLQAIVTKLKNEGRVQHTPMSEAALIGEAIAHAQARQLWLWGTEQCKDHAHPRDVYGNTVYSRRFQCLKCREQIRRELGL